MSVEQHTSRPSNGGRPDLAPAVPAPIAVRFGLNCIFNDPALRFRTITAARVLRLPIEVRMRTLGAIWLHNANILLSAVQRLHQWDIGAYVVYHPLLPLYTYPGLGVRAEDVVEWPEVTRRFGEVARYSRQHNIRLSFHPDQYVVLSSPSEDVRNRSVVSLRYHGQLCDWIGADVINIHLGGAYGDKHTAIARFVHAVEHLPDSIRLRLVIENDDASYTPTDVCGVTTLLNVPFTYDVHHHRLNPDGISVDEATRLAVRTWEARGMEPYFHIASGRDHSRAHAEVIDANDVPRCWLSLNQPVTVIVESKGREQAVFRLRNDMAAHPWRRHADRENECDARTGVLADGKQEKESDHETD